MKPQLPFVSLLVALTGACSVLPGQGPHAGWRLTLPAAAAPGLTPGGGQPADAGVLPAGGAPADAERGASAGQGSFPPSEPAVQTGDRASGHVVTFDGLNELPVSGATVRLSDGRQATTAADGSFAFAPPPADGVYMVSAPGRMASHVAGLMGDNVLLHVRGYAEVSRRESAATERPFRVSGRLVDAAGQPVAHVNVALEDPRGSYGLPAESAADGTFQMTVYGLEQRVEDGSFYAVGDPGVPWMALAEGLDFAAGVGTLDFDPASPGVDPLRLVAASHRVRLQLSDGGTGLSPGASFAIVGPRGTRMVLAEQGGEFLVAPIAGARFELDVSGRDDALGVESRVHRGDLRLDFNQPASVLSETLLAPPVFAAPTLASGQALHWTQPAGTDGVHVTLSREGPALWEAFSAASPLTLQLGGPPAGGAYRLKLTAIDERFTTARRVASLRALRALPLENSYRLASKEVQVSVAP